MNSRSGSTRWALVCFAVKEEARFFRPPAGANLTVQTLVTGMGRENARRELRSFLDSAASTPEFVLTCGFAGALDPSLECGALLHETDPDFRALNLGTVAAGVSPAVEPALPARREEACDRTETANEPPIRAAGRTPSAAGETPAATAGSRPARFHFAERVAVTAKEKQQLRASTGADAVEMESRIIRDLCRERDIPSATLRVISDTANEDLPLDFNALMTPDCRIDFVKLAASLARAPWRIPALLRLQKQTTLAAKNLAAGLDRFFQSAARQVQPSHCPPLST